MKLLYFKNFILALTLMLWGSMAWTQVQYSLRLGVVLDDMSKSNLERIKALSHAFNYRFGMDLRVVVQKRQDLLLKLYQNGSVDFILTGLPQVLALEKSEIPHKVILRSYLNDRSDPFIVLMAQHEARDSVKLQFPTERFLAGRSHIVLSETTASQKLFLPDISSQAERLVVKDITYTPQSFKEHFTTLNNPILLDMRGFPYATFGKIRSYRDKANIEKLCGCFVVKMSPPIPQQIMLANPGFYEQRPLQTYQLMEFFLHLANDPAHVERIKKLFDSDGFVTATNNIMTPFFYLYSRFKFAELASWDFKNL